MKAFPEHAMTTTDDDSSINTSGSASNGSASSTFHGNNNNRHKKGVTKTSGEDTTDSSSSSSSTYLKHDYCLMDDIISICLERLLTARSITKNTNNTTSTTTTSTTLMTEQTTILGQLLQLQLQLLLHSRRNDHNQDHDQISIAKMMESLLFHQIIKDYQYHQQNHHHQRNRILKSKNEEPKKQENKNEITQRRLELELELLLSKLQGRADPTISVNETNHRTAHLSSISTNSNNNNNNHHPTDHKEQDYNTDNNKIQTFIDNDDNDDNNNNDKNKKRYNTPCVDKEEKDNNNNDKNHHILLQEKVQSLQNQISQLQATLDTLFLQKSNFPTTTTTTNNDNNNNHHLTLSSLSSSSKEQDSSSVLDSNNHNNDNMKISSLSLESQSNPSSNQDSTTTTLHDWILVKKGEYDDNDDGVDGTLRRKTQQKNENDPETSNKVTITENGDSGLTTTTTTQTQELIQMIHALASSSSFSSSSPTSTTNTTTTTTTNTTAAATFDRSITEPTVTIPKEKYAEITRKLDELIILQTAAVTTKTKPRDPQNVKKISYWRNLAWTTTTLSVMIVVMVAIAIPQMATILKFMSNYFSFDNNDFNNNNYHESLSKIKIGNYSQQYNNNDDDNYNFNNNNKDSTDSRSSSSSSRWADFDGVAVITDNYQIVNIYDHDITSFTQGLVVHHHHHDHNHHHIIESTGIYGNSLIRQWNPETGEILQEYLLDSQYFGQGMTWYIDENDKERFVMLTWKEQTAFVFDASSSLSSSTFSLLEPIHSFEYPTTTNTMEGWGITFDPNGKVFYVSDGSEYIMVWNLQFEEIDRFAVSITIPRRQQYYGYHQQQQQEGEEINGEINTSNVSTTTNNNNKKNSAYIVRPLHYLNELEWDGDTGTILANVLGEDFIVRIIPYSGKIAQVYDLSQLYPNHTSSPSSSTSSSSSSSGEDVMNGIAKHPTKPNHWYITGKYWPNMYLIELTENDQLID